MTFAGAAFAGAAFAVRILNIGVNYIYTIGAYLLGIYDMVPLITYISALCFSWLYGYLVFNSWCMF
jgi:hypothetical protein